MQICYTMQAMTNNKMSRSDWQKDPAFLVRHGLFAIFYQTISDSEKIKKLYFANLRKNLLLEKELMKILSFLRKNRIDVIPLKGPIFTRQIYNDLALRQASVDFDFLIKKEDVENIIEKLNSWGYKFHPANKYPLDFVLRNRFEILFQKKNQTNLDFHWQARNDELAPEYTNHLWQTAKKKKNILLLPKEELLVFIAQSLAPEFESDFFPLKYLFDFNHLIRKEKNLNWLKIIRTIKKYQLEHIFYYALKMASAFFETPIPKKIIAEIKPNFIKRFFLEKWINSQKIFACQKGVVDNYQGWYYIGINWLFSKNFINMILKIGLKLKRRIK